MLQNSPQGAAYEEPIAQRAQNYLTDLQIPPELCNRERTAFAVFLMVESSKITKQRKLIPECKEPMQRHLSDIQPKFFDIFYENSKRTRLAFFNDPLVQHLWTKFRTQCKADFSAYIKEIYAQDQGKLKVKRFI